MLKVVNEKQQAEMKMAREGRLFLKEKRIAIEKARKAMGEQALREKQAIDGIAKVLKSLIIPIEKYLEQQEKFVEFREKERKEKERQELLAKEEAERIAREKAEAEERERIRKENERLKREAERVLDSFVGVVTEAIKREEKVAVTGFGAFRISQRKDRMGVKPQNPSEKITIPAVRVPKFTAGKTLKDNVR